MGGLMSRFRTEDEGDYKRILAELDDKIRLEEVRLSEIRVREKRSRIIWLAYASLFYVVYTVGWYFFGWRTSDVQEHWTMYGLKAMPVFVFPVIIFTVNNMMGWWYRRKQANEETQLGHLRAQQKLKLEELKKKTDYYAIKTLLEQYDAQSRSSGQEVRHRLPQSAAALPPNGATANGDALRPIVVAGDRPRTGAPARVREPLPLAPVQRAWYDRLLDAVVGDTGSSTKYALICASCHAHNGLVPQQELDDVAYVCPKCSSFNPSRRAIREGTAFQSPTSGDPSVPTATAATAVTAVKGNITPPRGRSTTPRPTTTSTSRDRLNHFNQVDSSQSYDLDDYDDDGVAVSKRLASRSNSRKRHRSRSQNGISGRRGSTGDVRRRYDTDTEDESISRPS